MADSKHAVFCDTCLQDRKRHPALTLCKECRELYCMNCSAMHTVIPITKKHLLIKISNAESDSKSIMKILPPVCSACELTGKGKQQAKFLCNECRDIYCDTCREHHLKLRITKDHTLYGIPILDGKTTLTSGGHDLAESIELASDFESFHISSENVRLTQAQSAISEVKDKSERSGIKCLTRRDIDKISVEFVTTFNARSETDKKNCNFYGISTLSQGRIVLADFNNDKIKLFDKTFKIISEVKSAKYVYGITRVSDDRVAVLHDDHISFYTIQQSTLVQESKSIDLESFTKGISFNGSVFAVIYDKKITVLSTDGDVLHQIKNIPNLKYSFYVCIDRETNNIYFSNDFNVNCVSTNSKLIWQKKSNFTPRGLIDFHDCLLIAADDKIILLTRDGKYHKTIFNDEDILTKAEYISFDYETDRLFVTEMKKSRVTVLQVHY